MLLSEYPLKFPLTQNTLRQKKKKKKKKKKASTVYRDVSL